MAFVTPASVFDEVFDFLASSPSAEALVAYGRRSRYKNDLATWQT